LLVVLYRIDKSIDPVKLVHDICEEARANPDQRKSRWIKRMIPITQIRKVLSVDLTAFAKEVLQPIFHADDVPKKVSLFPNCIRLQVSTEIIESGKVGRG
jgi:tRNA acetyltransferase TAN1